MKNPYKRGKVHPSPPSPLPDHFLSLLPAAIFALTAALSPDDRQVLAYLVSCCPNANAATATPARRRDGYPKAAGGGGGDDRGGGDHGPCFGCDCFRCYMSYWVRWDASPNRQLIHEIIEAYEEDQLLLSLDKNKGKKKKLVKQRGKNPVIITGDNSSSSSSGEGFIKGEGSSSAAAAVVEPASGSGFCPAGGDEVEEDEGSVDQLVGARDGENKGTVRKVVGFLGERIWGFWGRD